MLDDAGRLNGAPYVLSGRSDIGALRFPDYNAFLRRSLIRFLKSRDQARQLPNQVPGDRADENLSDRRRSLTSSTLWIAS
jgi:hypothetical protein